MQLLPQSGTGTRNTPRKGQDPGSLISRKLRGAAATLRSFQPGVQMEMFLETATHPASHRSLCLGTRLTAAHPKPPVSLCTSVLSPS